MHNLMTPNHPDWERFYGLLQGPEGCDFREDERGKITWRCAGGMDKSIATQILEKNFPGINVEASLAYFETRGGHCDCEIVFNVSSNTY